MNINLCREWSVRHVCALDLFLAKSLSYQSRDKTDSLTEQSKHPFSDNWLWQSDLLLQHQSFASHHGEMNSFHGPPGGSWGSFKARIVTCPLFDWSGQSQWWQRVLWSLSRIVQGIPKRLHLIKIWISEEFRVDEMVGFDPNLLLGLDMTSDPDSGSRDRALQFIMQFEMNALMNLGKFIYFAFYSL